ncbi:MAG TPA: hypothetical protein VGX25_27910 [Actinophytocola sp.]|uniref:hypothetical protein n=1 Tax=Actinophytocola sp. TaxID=1872138 RepID=UPI002DDCC927|nr:hypothetical protein [Actinophytocola sp.]HEV2783227.1 hypothetical protein [Actinophytocola sp.]
MDQADNPVSVVVSVADDHLDSFAEVVTDLRRAGLRVDDVLATVGMVTGTIAADSVEALDAVPGVAEVECQHAHRLPPPESDVQ